MNVDNASMTTIIDSTTSALELNLKISCMNNEFTIVNMRNRITIAHMMRELIKSPNTVL